MACEQAVVSMNCVYPSSFFFASLAQLAKAPSLFVFSVSGLKARELATPSFPSDCVAREGGTPRERGFANRLVFSILYENVTGRTGLALHCPLVPRSFARSSLPFILH